MESAHLGGEGVGIRTGLAAPGQIPVLPPSAAAPVWRLGVATRVAGAPLRAHDSRRWQQQPHLSVSLACVRDILAYLDHAAIRFYRLSSNLAPYATHPDLPLFHGQIGECATELAALGDEVRRAGFRLTMHPSPYVRLESADEALVRRAQQELTVAAHLLDAMGLDDNSVLVIHAGSDAGEAALARVARHVEGLAPAVRRRLAVENGDRGADLRACLWLHRRTGLPVVLDVLHHRCLNPSRLPLEEALRRALATWPANLRPKIHLSTSRTELRSLRRNGRAYVVAPLPNQHSDFISPFECVELLRAALSERLRPFDIMLEAKAHELALLRLRSQIGFFAPELAGLVA